MRLRYSRELPGRSCHLRPLRAPHVTLTLSAVALVAFLSGCGGHGHVVARLCRPATAIVARSSSVSVRDVRVWETRDYAELRYCHYAVARSSARPGAQLLVTVDTTPQPLWRLHRTEAEYAQGFGTPTGRPLDPPAHIDGLGLDADWLPVEQEVMATDNARLITVAPTSPHATRERLQKLAENVARAFLSPPTR